MWLRIFSVFTPELVISQQFILNTPGGLTLYYGKPHYLTESAHNSLFIQSNDCVGKVIDMFCNRHAIYRPIMKTESFNFPIIFSWKSAVVGENGQLFSLSIPCVTCSTCILTVLGRVLFKTRNKRIYCMTNPVEIHCRYNCDYIFLSPFTASGLCG